MPLGVMGGPLFCMRHSLLILKLTQFSAEVINLAFVLGNILVCDPQSSIQVSNFYLCTSEVRNKMDVCAFDY